MKISSISIKNFKGISDMTIIPLHLNVYLGPNGTGKSSILNALAFALTGKIKAGFIRKGTKSTKVTLEFEDGSTIERTRNGSGTEVRCNGKKTTGKSTSEFLENKLGASEETYEALLGIDYLESLSRKDLSSLFLSILPATLSYDYLCNMADDIIKKDFGRNMEEEEKDFLETFFSETNGSFGLNEVARAYQEVFDKRKELKILVKNLEAKSEFDETTLPKETKEEFETALYGIAKQETEAAAYQKNLAAYERSKKAREDAQKRQDALRESLKEYANVSKAKPEVETQAKEDKAKFERAIHQVQGLIATLKSNVAIFEKTLCSLDKPVCPISEKLVCTTNKSGLKTELTDLVSQNQSGIAKNEAFVKRCEEQIEKRNKLIADYNVQLVLYTKKEGIEKQIQEFVFPELLEKPQEVKTADFSKEKEAVNQKLRLLAAYEQTLKSKSELSKMRKELKQAELAVHVLDTKTGVPAAVLAVTMRKFEDICNQKAQSIRKDFKLQFLCEDGIEVLVKPGEDAAFIPMDMVSTGEYVIVAYLLMHIINQITAAKYLVIDNLDKLDAEYFKTFIDLLDRDTSYEHIFVGAVDHADTKKLLGSMNVTTL